MAKVQLNSPAGTKRVDMTFVIEVPTVSRTKMRLGDIEGELSQIEEQLINLTKRKVELEDIKTKMEALI